MTTNLTASTTRTCSFRLLRRWLLLNKRISSINNTIPLSKMSPFDDDKYVFQKPYLNIDWLLLHWWLLIVFLVGQKRGTISFSNFSLSFWLGSTNIRLRGCPSNYHFIKHDINIVHVYVYRRDFPIILE